MLCVFSVVAKITSHAMLSTYQLSVREQRLFIYIGHSVNVTIAIKHSNSLYGK